MIWFTVSSTCPHILHLLSSCVLLIFALMILARIACSSAAIIIDSCISFNSCISLIIIIIFIIAVTIKSLLLMLEDLKLNKNAQKQLIRKIINIAIRCSYYVFCCRNKPLTTPELLDF